MTYPGTSIRRHRAPRSRRGRRYAGALTIAAALVAAALLPSVAVQPAGATPAALAEDPALTHAREQLQWCYYARTQARTASERAWTTTCLTLAERVLDAFTPPSPTASPSTTVAPTTTPAPTTTTPPPASTPSPTPPAAGFPNAQTTGTPPGWQPTVTRGTDLMVTGGVVEDVRFTGGADLTIAGPNVTVRRVEFLGGRIDTMPGSTCFRVRVEQTTFRRPAGTVTDADQEGAITPGGWSVDGSLFDGVVEGLRAGQKAACGANAISNSFIRIRAPDVCADWHGDGVQGYDGGAVTVRNVVIDFIERPGCGGTAPWFYPSGQGNTSVDIDGLLVSGGGYAFRTGMPGRVANLKIVDGSWGYGPIDVRCSVLSEWSAHIVTVDAAWQPTTVRAQACDTEGGT